MSSALTKREGKPPVRLSSPKSTEPNVSDNKGSAGASPAQPSVVSVRSKANQPRSSFFQAPPPAVSQLLPFPVMLASEGNIVTLLRSRDRIYKKNIARSPAEELRLESDRLPACGDYHDATRNDVPTSADHYVVPRLDRSVTVNGAGSKWSQTQAVIQ